MSDEAGPLSCIAGVVGMLCGWVTSFYIAWQIAAGHAGLVWWIVFLAVWGFVGSLLGWVFVYPPVLLAVAIESVLKPKQKD